MIILKKFRVGVVHYYWRFFFVVLHRTSIGYIHTGYITQPSITALSNNTGYFSFSSHAWKPCLPRLLQHGLCLCVSIILAKPPPPPLLLSRTLSTTFFLSSFLPTQFYLLKVPVHSSVCMYVSSSSFLHTALNFPWLACFCLLACQSPCCFCCLVLWHLAETISVHLSARFIFN